MKERALALIKVSVPEWKDIDEDHIQMRLLLGTSNKVYEVKHDLNLYPNKIIYRYFGPAEITDKESERAIFDFLSVVGIAPKSYLSTKEERLEEFLDGYVPIAKDVCFNKPIIDLLMKELLSFHAVEPVFPDEGLTCIENPAKWRQKALGMLDNGMIPPKYATELDSMLRNDELWLEFTRLLPSNAPVVFGHMDAHPLNFLYNEQSNKVRIIDYEFAGKSYAALDIAEFLVEITYDYNYPEPPFWKRCLEFNPSDETVAEYVKSYGGGPDMWVDVKKCMVAFHYIWGIWAIAMYDGNEDGFNYVTYAISRLNTFQAALQEYHGSGGHENLVSEYGFLK